MAIQVNPITQSLPATTAIQDPAVRRFAQAVDDALRALRSEEGAVESLKKAADAMNGAVAGGTPPSIAQWLFSSELYQKLTTEIARVDTQAKQDVLDEALSRSQAIQEIRAALAEIESTPAYDPATTYQIGDLVTYDNKLYRAKSETTGNLPTNTVYWDKVGDYATIGDVVAAHTLQLSEIESDITNIGGDLTAEITARDTLATQLRGTYPGADVAMVSQGLLYSERQARVTADGVTVSNLNALRAQVGVTEAGALTEGFILDEQAIRNTNDLAIVSAVNTALAQITGVSASISQSGQNLIANWTQAQATKWSQIEAEVLTSGGQTIRAALLQESQVRANADGSLGAQWTIKTDINGYISGIGFASTANNAAPTSEFIINADRFVMSMPGYGNHVPFAIGPSGAEFTGLTRWGNVQSRPGDEDILNAGKNLCPNPDLLGNLGDDTTAPGWVPSYVGAPPYRLRYVTAPASIAPPWDATQPVFYSYADSADDATYWRTGYIPVDASKVYHLSCYAMSQWATACVYLGVECYNASGTIIAGGNVYVLGGFQGLTGTYLQYGGTIGPGQPVNFHAGTVKVRIIWIGAYLQAGGSMATRFCFNEGKVPSKSVLPPDLIGQHNPITPSNVTTYIANAALGNAQIGGNLWSTNWNYAGGTGWLLDRSGNFYCNNIYARGDIEASSLKANTAMVQTLNIAGNAVIVPTYVEYPSSAAYDVYQNGTEAEWTLLSDVVTVNVDCSALIFIGCNDIITPTTHTVSAGAGSLGHYNWPTGTEWASIRLYRNGSLVKRLAQWNVSSTKKGNGRHTVTYSDYERDCVFIDTLVAEIHLVAGTNTIDIRGWVRMADGNGVAKRNSNSYMLIMGTQR